MFADHGKDRPRKGEIGLEHDYGKTPQAVAASWIITELAKERKGEAEIYDKDLKKRRKARRRKHGLAMARAYDPLGLTNRHGPRYTFDKD